MVGSDGSVLCEEAFRQPVLFEGIRIGLTGTPTDIDLSFDAGPDCFCFCEVKHRRARFSGGQRLHLTRLVDAIEGGGRNAIAILAAHDVDDRSQAVIAASCEVVMFYRAGRWSRPESSINLADAIHRLCEKWRGDRS